MKTDAMKKAAGYKAAELVQEGMVVGLGTGSTAAYLIERLGELYRAGLRIHVVASSNRTFQLATQEGLPFVDINTLSHIDLTLDGADEIDSQKRMIKGGGGALVREKILANMSRELVIMVDESKLVPALGHHPLPVEIIPFGIQATLNHMEKAGYKGKLRKDAGAHKVEVDKAVIAHEIEVGGGPVLGCPPQLYEHLRKDKADNVFVTDNGNYIVDIHFSKPREHPEDDHERLRRIPGVVDTGFFFHLAGRVLIGFSDGQVAVK